MIVLVLHKSVVYELWCKCLPQQTTGPGLVRVTGFLLDVSLVWVEEVVQSMQRRPHILKYYIMNCQLQKQFIIFVLGREK